VITQGWGNHRNAHCTSASSRPYLGRFAETSIFRITNPRYGVLITWSVYTKKSFLWPMSIKRDWSILSPDLNIFTECLNMKYVRKKLLHCQPTFASILFPVQALKFQSLTDCHTPRSWNKNGSTHILSGTHTFVFKWKFRYLTVCDVGRRYDQYNSRLQT
jgi:hypothetical protein